MGKPEIDIIVAVSILTAFAIVAHVILFLYLLKRSRRLILKEVKEHITINLLKEFDEHMEKTVRSRQSKKKKNTS